jgi:transcriptional regulator with XRE-family HTH domain
MKFEYDGEKLSKAVRTKRLIEMKIDIRTAANEIDISAATLSRLENMKTPDAIVLAAVCNWISMPMNDFFIPVKQKNKSHK